MATKDVHYLEKEDQEAHEVLLCIQTGKTIEEEERMSMADEDFSFASFQEMKEAFPNQKKAIANSVNIAKKCNIVWIWEIFICPKLKCPGARRTAPS